jgi:hypothetical protein
MKAVMHGRRLRARATAMAGITLSSSSSLRQMDPAESRKVWRECVTLCPRAVETRVIALGDAPTQERPSDGSPLRAGSASSPSMQSVSSVKRRRPAEPLEEGESAGGREGGARSSMGRVRASLVACDEGDRGGPAREVAEPVAGVQTTREEAEQRTGTRMTGESTSKPRCSRIHSAVAVGERWRAPSRPVVVGAEWPAWLRGTMSPAPSADAHD